MCRNSLFVHNTLQENDQYAGTKDINVSSGITSYISDTINNGINAMIAQNKANKQFRLL